MYSGLHPALLVSLPMGSDDSPAPDASHLTPEENRGPQTLHVALLLLAVLFAVSVASDPELVLPRGSTLLGAHHTDDESGLEVPVPVGWEVTAEPAFGSTQLAPVEAGPDPATRIIAGRLDPGIAAAAIADDRGAATALAEIVQLYVLGAPGPRDEQRFIEVENDIGTGAASSFVVTPGDTAAGSGGLVYAAVFGSGVQRSWLAFLTTEQTSAPSLRWIDRLVADVRATE